jgi:hypothetical protein
VIVKSRLCNVAVFNKDLKMFNTREEYLKAMIEELRPLFDFNGHPLPLNIRVTCGFPLNAKRSGAIGECHPSINSSDNHYEISISPVLADVEVVCSTLIHELAHTLKGCMNHGVNFAKACDAMGLVPHATAKYKATSAGVDFVNRYGKIIDSLGAYPHAELNFANRKTQTTRMLKACCPTCGYTVRLTSKWAYNAHGDLNLPICPNDQFDMELA